MFHDRAADGGAELLTLKVLQRLAVRSVGCERFQALVVEDGAVQLISAGFRNHIDHAAGAASEFRAGAAGDDLKLLDRVQGDVDRCPLSADLFTEEAVVVVAAIKADVVEDAALAGKTNLVAVRALHHTHARCESKKVFKLSAQDRRLADRAFIQRSA